MKTTKQAKLNTSIFCIAFLCPMIAKANICEPEIPMGKINQWAEVSHKTSKLYFYTADSHCPKNKCQTKQYVVPSDKVFINDYDGEWACVLYSGKQLITNWLKTSNLELERKHDNAPISAWIGHWRSDWGDIKIAQHGSSLEVTGDVRRIGSELQDGSHSESAGDIKGVIQPLNNKAHLTNAHESNCSLDFTIVNQNLIVIDNGQCGGMDVSFQGLYTKHK